MNCLKSASSQRRMASIVVVICLFGLWATSAVGAMMQEPLKQAISDVEWDAVFSRTEGWTGGDVAGTVDLGDDRTLWMFGDSWIGKVAGGKHAPGLHMVNNAVGTHPRSALGDGRAPRYDELKFFWGPDNKEKKPTAWVIPQADTADRWYWSSGGGVVVPGPNRQLRLIVFLFHLKKRGEKNSSWNFKHIGSAMAIVDNVEQPVDKWKVRQLSIPYSIGSGLGAGDSSVRETNWGVAALLRKEHQEGVAEATLYIYGVHNAQRLNKQLMLARVPASQVDKLDQWRFYSGKGRWSARASDAVHIADRMASELSVDEYVAEGRSTFVMVHSEPVFGRRIMVRTAPSPEGPWSKPQAVYSVPGLDRGKDYFTYAAKGHLHLSRKNELLVTYIINANDIWDMAVDAAIYRPRFLRVPLNRVLPQRASQR